MDQYTCNFARFNLDESFGHEEVTFKLIQPVPEDALMAVTDDEGLNPHMVLCESVMSLS